MIEFKKLTVQSYEELAPYFKGLNYVLADYSFGYLFMYDEYVGYEYLIEEEVLYVRFLKDGKYVWLTPMCLNENDLLKAIRRIREIEKEEIESVLRSVPERLIPLISEQLEISVEKITKWADYVYEIGPFSALKGKKYHAKRNYISRFARLYGIADFEPIEENNLSAVLDFFEKFKEGESKDARIFDMELKATSLMLNNLSTIKAEGYVMRVAGEIVGFTIGEISGNTLIVHIEKCNKEYEGVYETLTNRFVRKMMDEYPALVYVNREDDAGDEGLRKSKLSYHPVYIAPKCEVKVH